MYWRLLVLEVPKLIFCKFEQCSNIISIFSTFDNSNFDKSIDSNCPQSWNIALTVVRDEESISPKLTYFKLPQLWNINSIVVTFEKFIIDKSIDTNFVQLWNVCFMLTREVEGIFPNFTSVNSPQPKNIAIKLGVLEKSNLDKSTDFKLEHPWNNTSTFVGEGAFVSPNVTFCKSEQPKNVP